MNLFRSPRVWMAAWLTLGLFASAYLLVVYVTGGPIVCGAAGGCEVVRASRWAQVGSLPRPLFGVVFYTAMFALLIARALTPWREQMLRRLVFIGACIGVIESIHLFFVQWLSIHAFCLWCLMSGLATLGVFFSAIFDRSSLTESQRLNDLRGYALMYGLLILLGAPGLWFLLR